MKRSHAYVPGRHEMHGLLTTVLMSAGTAGPLGASGFTKPSASLLSPEGMWAPFDDRSGRRGSLVEIRVQDGVKEESQP